MSTIAKALRDKKSLANQLKTDHTRAIKGSVSSAGSEKLPDFNTEEYINLYLQHQQDLRELKTNVAETTVNCMVNIPKEIPVKEAGKTVTLFRAILIRDDLKSFKSFLGEILNTETKDIEFDFDLRKHVTKEDKKRNFEFEKILLQVDSLQESIDTIDALIQYTDNTQEI